jgi:hypothetical protein
MICQRRVFLLNNVYFDQKLVSLCSNIRLLERDEENINRGIQRLRTPFVRTAEGKGRFLNITCL